MKVSYELKQGYIDIWNEESEEWDRYIKVNKKSNVEEEKKIPEKLDIWYSLKGTVNEEDMKEMITIMFEELKDKYNQLIDYLKSKEG